MAPKATDVCKRCWKSPTPYLSVIVTAVRRACIVPGLRPYTFRPCILKALDNYNSFKNDSFQKFYCFLRRSLRSCTVPINEVTGTAGTIITLAIGYYMVYRSENGIGLCLNEELPGIRRACVLDLVGGMMSMVLGVLLLIIELVSAYINQKDWKVVFSVIKIIINTIVTIVLGTGTIQGAASYGEYYEKDLESFHCDFNHHQRKYDSDIDFLAVVIVSGISAFVWVVSLVVEIVQLSVLLFGPEAVLSYTLGINTRTHGINTHTHNRDIQDEQTELLGAHDDDDDDDAPAPQYSEV